MREHLVHTLDSMAKIENILQTGILPSP